MLKLGEGERKLAHILGIPTNEGSKTLNSASPSASPSVKMLRATALSSGSLRAMIRKSIGKYRIVDKQDRETGTVYRAVDDAISREVAIKILSADVEDSDVFKRFGADAAVLATLNHHELAAIYEVTRVERDLLIVMELVRGESLDQLLKRSGPLPPERAGYLVWQVLGALSPAHEAGIVHGDIRPSNLMVFGGSMKILDFGLASFADAARPTTDSSLTATPVYMAPEQVRADERRPPRRPLLLRRRVLQPADGNGPIQGRQPC